MAKVLSHMHSIIRGSVGGVTYSANRYAQIIMRARTVPTNPQREFQELMRSIMADSSEAWKQLLQSERDAWESYAQTLEYQGPLGPYSVPARNVFMGSYSVASYAQARGLGSVVAGDEPPDSPGFLNLGNVQSTDPQTALADGIGFQATNGTGEAITLLAWRSFAFEPTKGYYNGPWVQEDTQGVDIAASTSGVGEFIGLTVGKKYFMKLRAVSQAEPIRISPEYVISMIAKATP